MAQNTEFGKEVRKLLIDRDMSVADLAKEVADKTGLYCDATYIYHIFRGDRNPPKIVEAIKETLNMDKADGN